MIHHKADNVGVAIDDIRAGEEVDTIYIEDKTRGPRVKALEDVPLGHKIALRDIREGDDVIKYGRSIGRAVKYIAAGEHVHTHNVKSKRWSFGQ
ncbi:MAG: UxaA family hydrolase [Thermoproteus sp.]|nr:UxaA family hydrolase [Thermoproteus sp.]